MKQFINLPCAGTSSRCSVLVAPAVLFGLCVAASPAVAQDLLSVDASASAGVSSNPFLQAGPTSAAITGTLGIRPSWVSERPLTTLRIDANANLMFYDKDYGTNGSVTVQGSAMHRLSERTTLNGSISYVNTIVGSFGDVGVPIGTPVGIAIPAVGSPAASDTTTVPVVVPVQQALPTYVSDPVLNGIGRRRQAYLVSGGISTLLSPHDQLSFNLSASANRSSGDRALNPLDLQDFNYFTPIITYSRTIDAKTSVGTSFSVGITDYLGTRTGDARIYQPSLIATRVIGQRWTLSGSLGAAIVDLNEIDGTSRTSTSLNGAANLCRRDVRWTGCLSASRQTLPSSFQGVRTQTSIAASFDHQVNARDTLSFNGGYSRASGPIQQVVVGDPHDQALQFVSASSSYSHRFTRTWSGFATVGYAKALDDNVFRRDANYTVLVGASYSFGRKP